jgi:hypothetical protein
LRLLTRKNIEAIVNIQKNQVIPLLKKIPSPPSDNIIDCLKFSSSIGPRMKAIRNGGAGKLNTFIR